MIFFSFFHFFSSLSSLASSSDSFCCSIPFLSSPSSLLPFFVCLHHSFPMTLPFTFVFFCFQFRGIIMHAMTLDEGWGGPTHLAEGSVTEMADMLPSSQTQTLPETKFLLAHDTPTQGFQQQAFTARAPTQDSGCWIHVTTGRRRTSSG